MTKRATDTGGDEDQNLPLTTEVGSEGGSYTDAVLQEETLKGDLPTAGQTTKSRPDGSVAGAVPRNPEDAEDGIRFPTEPPVTPDEPE